jgi:beta-glucosidase
VPTTWPKAMADAPVLDVTPAGGRLEYGEGLDIGHRAYLARGTEPAYWFGHGLGYTTWAYEGIESPAEAGAEGWVATVRLRNIGERPGKQVVQVYAARPNSTVGSPVRWLAGFAVVHAAPGELVEVAVPVDRRTLRHWDPDLHAWAVEPGEIVLCAGPHAGDLPVRTSLTLEVAGVQA